MLICVPVHGFSIRSFYNFKKNFKHGLAKDSLFSNESVIVLVASYIILDKIMRPCTIVTVIIFSSRNDSIIMITVHVLLLVKGS